MPHALFGPYFTKNEHRPLFAWVRLDVSPEERQNIVRVPVLILDRDLLRIEIKHDDALGFLIVFAEPVQLEEDVFVVQRSYKLRKIGFDSDLLGLGDSLLFHIDVSDGFVG